MGVGGWLTVVYVMDGGGVSIPALFRSVCGSLSALMMDNNEKGSRAGPVTLFHVSGRFGLGGYFANHAL